jgi:hypothetical protein
MESLKRKGNDMEKTLRDEIAIAALQGLLSSDVCAVKREFAIQAYQMADAMLEARAKPEANGLLTQDLHKSDLARACEMSREYAQTLEDRLAHDRKLFDDVAAGKAYWQDAFHRKSIDCTNFERCAEESRAYAQTLEEQFEAACRGSRWVASAEFQEENSRLKKLLKEVLSCPKIERADGSFGRLIGSRLANDIKEALK